LWAAGITRALPGFEQTEGDDRKRFCALQTDTSDTLAVDFHSFRRAFTTGLAVSGVNVQTAMALAGHSDVEIHMRYVLPATLVTPAGALPQLAPQPTEPEPPVVLQAPGPPFRSSAGAKPDNLIARLTEILNDLTRARQDSNLRPTAPEAVALSS
jgi:hypothetical protein